MSIIFRSFAAVITIKKTIIMKRLITLVLLAAAILLPASAQHYRSSQYYEYGSSRLNYGTHESWFGTGDLYYGVRIGPSFSKVNSDDPDLDGGNWQTGLNIGVMMGIPLTDRMPLFIETGLQYTEKGGKKKVTSMYKDEKRKMTYDLNYIELPIVLKYIYDIDGHFTIHPFFGGYLACGVGGKIKNYADREAFSSFSDEAFQRFDGGLRLGCGVGYDLFYLELAYDIGLSNICHDMFDTSHNRSLALNFGVNF